MLGLGVSHDPAFRFSGSNPPPLQADGIAREIVERGLEVSYVAFAHVEGATPKRLRLLRESGCLSLYYGVESRELWVATRASREALFRDARPLEELNGTVPGRLVQPSVSTDGLVLFLIGTWHVS